MSVMQHVFGSRSQREIHRMMPVVHKIEALRDKMMSLDDKSLQHKTVEFQNRMRNGATLDDLLPEAFAVVREASRRVLGLEHYEEQLLGGIVLYHGQIAELQTGEGKTITAALPSYLMALKKKGVHVVTVNDYLAKRDAEEIGKIHEFLGLTVGCVLQNMPTEARKAAYACDVTYITNNELGFDYLRDNMASSLEKCVQRPLYYCIIDEVDSILIDEARVPLIISGAGTNSVSLYESCNLFAKTLKKGYAKELTKMDILSGETIQETGDYVVDEKDKAAHLTEVGVKKAEKFFGLQNLADPSNLEIQHHISMALKAHGLMHKDKDYVVKDGTILIVDEFTGRIMEGRRYSDGLHQAIEAKENVEIQKENRTMATITLQNFFNKYEKKAGMTGTAATEAQEFKEIYHMRVVSIPTHKKVIRKDLDDLVYFTKQAKYIAIVKKIKELYKTKQPVLVGTTTIEVSETLSNMLSLERIPHQVLNAKFHEKEAEIVSHAGEGGMVTIATNMAGRGTDIKLDSLARVQGGLYIIGTERHESRRIDNQLRGRSGRQGDPGVSQFYISLEDDVLRLFGSESMLKMFRNLGLDENDVIEHRRMSTMVARAQKRIEGNHFMVRKSLKDFDAVNNEQRELIYQDRRNVLEGLDMSGAIQHMMQELIDDMVHHITDEKSWTQNFVPEWRRMFGQPLVLSYEDAKMELHLSDSLMDMAESYYVEKEAEVTPELMRRVERLVLLKCIDSSWMRHIDGLDQLRQNVTLVGYGQRDPVLEYRQQAFEMFDEMLLQIRKDVIRMLFHAKLVEKPQKDTETDN